MARVGQFFSDPSEDGSVGSCVHVGVCKGQGQGQENFNTCLKTQATGPLLGPADSRRVSREKGFSDEISLLILLETHL